MGAASGKKPGPPKGSPQYGGRKPQLDASGNKIINALGNVLYSPNKITKIAAEIARDHTDLAIGVYVDTIKATREEQAFDVLGEPRVDDKGDPVVVLVPLYPNELRQRAADKILDRAWGLPTQDFKIDAQMRIAGSIDHHVFVTIDEMKKLSNDELVKSFRDKVAGSSTPLMIEHEPTRKTG